MTLDSVYVVCATSKDFRYRHAEELFFQKQAILEIAEGEGRRLEVELICVEYALISKVQRRRFRLLTLVGAQKFDRVVFRGDSVTPYIAALRKMASSHTEVLNKAEKDSNLDIYLKMFDYDRLKSAPK